MTEVLSCRSSPGQPCKEGVDPRRMGTCYRCGMKMPAAMSWGRDPDLERGLVAEAAKAAGVADTDALVAFAQRRAGPLQVRNFMARDFDLEIREELADAANYCVWGILQAQEHGRDPQRLANVLGLVAAAYGALHQ